MTEAATKPPELSEEEFDVRGLLAQGLQRIQDEEGWIAEHEGALAASRIGGCLRVEKFRLLGAPRQDNRTDGDRRRMYAGILFQEGVRRRLVASGRRARVNHKAAVKIDGIEIRGMPDFVLTEGVLEVKTTDRWSVEREHLPFSHLIQLGTYMFDVERAGQMLYIGGMGRDEWTFDFPSLPEVWQPHAENVARLFRDHPGADVTPFACERLWCRTCDYLQICAREEPGEEEMLDEAQRQLLAQAARRYELARASSAASEKEASAAKAALLGFRHLLGTDDKGVSRFEAEGVKVRITDTSRSSLDQKEARAILERMKVAVPVKESSYESIRVELGE